MRGDMPLAGHWGPQDWPPLPVPLDSGGPSWCGGHRKGIVALRMCRESVRTGREARMVASSFGSPYLPCGQPGRPFLDVWTPVTYLAVGEEADGTLADTWPLQTLPLTFPPESPGLPSRD